MVIQCHWRRFRARGRCVQSDKQRWASRVISAACYSYVKRSQVRQRLRLVRQRQLDHCRAKQNDLKAHWSDMTSRRHVVLHIPSLGLAAWTRAHLNDLPLRENYQIGRLCDLENPNVDVIYVSPVPMDDTILQYYQKLVGANGVVQNERTHYLRRWSHAFPARERSDTDNADKQIELVHCQSWQLLGLSCSRSRETRQVGIILC